MDCLHIFPKIVPLEDNYGRCGRGRMAKNMNHQHLLDVETLSRKAPTSPPFGEIAACDS
jgi:hypothetical protein